MKLKHCLSVVMLGVGGCIALVMNKTEIAAFCFGAIASWGLVNGAREATKDKGEG